MSETAAPPALSASARPFDAQGELCASATSTRGLKRLAEGAARP